MNTILQKEKCKRIHYSIHTTTEQDLLKDIIHITEQDLLNHTIATVVVMGPEEVVAEKGNSIPCH